MIYAKLRFKNANVMKTMRNAQVDLRNITANLHNHRK